VAGDGTGSSDFAIAIKEMAAAMRGILLWVIGIPIPIVILLYLFGVL
jgi:hypothetical protein